VLALSAASNSFRWKKSAGRQISPHQNADSIILY
jgi:hypothetical protein